MDKYILQKELPYLKAGTVYFKNESFSISIDKTSYLPEVVGMRHERFAIHSDWVENNPEWFKKVEPELKWFVVPEEIGFGWKAIEQHIGQMGGYAGTKYFDTEEEAHSWIIENKPCLSLNEVVHLRPAWINNHYMGQLKELVKSKL